MKQTSEFKLTGMSRPQSFTCETSHNQHIFWVNNGLGADKFGELWNYCKDNWSDEKIAEIEHDGLYDNGLPKNPILIGIRETNS